jgi:DNA-binding response OmpR family regulator
VDPLRWVLLVEDDPDHRVLLRQAVGRVDDAVELHEAHDFAEAVRWITGRRQAGEALDDGLVVLDLGLPGPSGFDLLEWVRDREIDALSVFVLTASQNAMDADHAFNLGARGYFQKPADFRDYASILGRMFELAAGAGRRGGGT